jgi:hypothetical protein
VLLGRLVTFDPARAEVEEGALYIGADERIAAVQSRTEPAPAGFGSARRVETRGCVYPGLIDLHSHVVYNVLPLWSPPGTTEPFVNRRDWPKHGDYEGDGLRPGERARGAGGEGTGRTGAAKRARPRCHGGRRAFGRWAGQAWPFSPDRRCSCHGVARTSSSLAGRAHASATRRFGSAKSACRPPRAGIFGPHPALLTAWRRARRGSAPCGPLPRYAPRRCGCP